MRRLAVLAVLAATSAAHADDRARAESYFQAGEKAYRAQNFAAAAEDFEEAYKALAAPEIAFSAAQAYRRQYRVDPQPRYAVRAVELYRAYLEKVKTGGRVADAVDALADMQRELDRLIKSGVEVSAKLAAEHTQLGINVALAGSVTAGGMHEIEDKPAPSTDVRVTLDGAPAAPFALINVTPGTHTFHVEAAGFYPQDREAVAVQGTSVLASVTLEPKPGRILVATESGAHVEVDGRMEGRAPLAPIEVPAGKHLVVVGHRGRVPIVRELVLTNDQQVNVDGALVTSSRRRAVPWLAGGAGVLALAACVTGTFAYLAERDALAIRSDKNTVGNLDPSAIDTYNDDRARRDALVTTTWILGGAAIVTGAVGFALYRFDDPHPDATRVEPVISPAMSGAQVSGHF